MDMKTWEALLTVSTFLLSFLGEGRVLYSSNTKDSDLMAADSVAIRHYNDRGILKHRTNNNNTTPMTSKSYNEVNSSPWEFDSLLAGGSTAGGRDLQGEMLEPQSEFTQILQGLRGMSLELQELRTAVGNLKYQNHVIYKQLKRVNSKCLANSVPMAKGLVAEERRLCPKEFVWNSDFGKCYSFSSDRITWRMANERCMLQDAQLVSIESQREMSFLTEVARKTKDLRHCDFWAGGERSKDDPAWRWRASKKPLAYTNWNHGEPNNGAGHEHCLQLLWVFGWRWNDARCNSVNSCFICQKTVPEIF